MQNHKDCITAPIREALEYIGIRQAEQFAKKNSTDLWGEINTFWTYFPEKQTDISLKELQEAQHIMIKQLEEQENKSNDEINSKAKAQFENSPLLNLLNKTAQQKQNAQAPPEYRSKVSISFHTQALEHMEGNDSDEIDVYTLPRISNIKHKCDNSHLKQDASKAIRAKHPIWTYTMAILTVFAIPLLSLVFFLPLIAYFTHTSPTALIIALVLGCIYLGIYTILSRYTSCEICQCKTFTLNNFPYSKFAHKFLFLGVPLSTALHIIFTTWYRCPACGSAKKLFKPHSQGRKQKRQKMNRNDKR